MRDLATNGGRSESSHVGHVLLIITARSKSFGAARLVLVMMVYNSCDWVGAVLSALVELIEDRVPVADRFYTDPTQHITTIG